MAASQQYEQSSQQYKTYCTSSKHQFGQPQSEKDIQTVKESHVLKKMLQNTEWAQSIWREWATHRLEQLTER